MWLSTLSTNYSWIYYYNEEITHIDINNPLHDSFNSGIQYRCLSIRKNIYIPDNKEEIFFNTVDEYINAVIPNNTYRLHNKFTIRDASKITHIHSEFIRCATKKYNIDLDFVNVLLIIAYMEKFSRKYSHNRLALLETGNSNLVMNGSTKKRTDILLFVRDYIDFCERRKLHHLCPALFRLYDINHFLTEKYKIHQHPFQQMMAHIFLEMSSS